jgi:hypothetical protein
MIAACYVPSPPSGSYLCGEEKACPVGQSCTCGLCVNHPGDAACGFDVTVDNTSVEEHEQLMLTVTAQNGPGFNGTVALSSTWGDVFPSTVTLASGTRTVPVWLNRETIPPRDAQIVATFAGNSGKSNGITVVAPHFKRDPNAIVAPNSKFGFSSLVVTQPNVVRAPAGGYRMYYVGNSDLRVGLGVATSTDGIAFTPELQPLLVGAPMGDSMNPESPSAFFGAPGDPTRVAFSVGGVGNSSNAIQVGTSPDGLMPLSVAGNAIQKGDCAYCANAISFPNVIPDPSVTVPDGGSANAWVMYFSAVTSMQFPSIGRAVSTDGLRFTPDPAAVLSSDLTDEVILLSPRVLVDGSVLKMWYSYARVSDIRGLDRTNINFCDAMNSIRIGYATSADGQFWIRSPSNPAVDVDGTGWDASAHALLTGSAVTVDNPSGPPSIALYYTVFTNIVTTCAANGIGRAVRP